MYYFAHFAFMSDMIDLNPTNHALQNLRCKLINICILSDRRINLPAFHCLSQSSYLIQNMVIQWLVINCMCLFTFVWVSEMMGAAIAVVLSIC